MTRDLTVIIVSHNSAGDLGECLDSVFSHRGRIEMEVIVADAGSTDETAAVARRFPIVFLPGSNDGFARRNNAALAHPAARSSRYVLFLNPDTAIRSGSLASFLARCDERPRPGVFTTRQVDEDGGTIASIYRFPSPARYWAEALPIGPLRARGQKILEPEAYERESECDWAMGSFLLLSRAALEALGGFDERFFLYSEDVDLCRRAAALGWRVVYLPDLSVLHRGPSRMRRVGGRGRPLTHSKLIYAHKWLPRRDLLAMRVALIVRHGREVLDPARSPVARRSALDSLRAALSLVGASGGAR
jgi:GT2 family glycosyltransferase